MTLDSKAGSTIGGFVLDTYLGGGSFGEVWRGHEATTGQQVAVKLLTGALSSSETAGMHAEVELLAAAAGSRSKHIVQVLGGGAEPVPYIVMEYVEGKDLADLIKEKGKLSVEETIDIGLAMSEALAALNDVGIIHRDIKPANVMIDTNGVFKLADFGIAKIVGYDTQTMTGHTAMTMAYAAPELWDDGSTFGHPSHKSDLYALGVLLFQCLTGQTPFSGNYGALYKAHTQVAPDIKALPRETPPSLRTMIQLCMEKKQEGRPGDANSCTQMLERAKTEIAGSAATVAEPPQLGPWIKGVPDERQPWAWHCHHESRDATATVEVHFADSLDYGAGLRKALSANAKLAPLGAERLLETNRLLLHPNERWQSPPAGRFQFWFAREDLAVEPATTITRPILEKAVVALAALIDAAAAADLTLTIRDNLTVLASGGIYVRRPGMDAELTDSDIEAWEVIRTLPLDAEAAAIVARTGDFRTLVHQFAGTAEGATVVVGRGDQTVVVGRDSGQTVVVGSRPAEQEVCPYCKTPIVPGQAFCGSCGRTTQPQAVPEEAPLVPPRIPVTPVAPANLQMGLKPTSHNKGDGWFELMLQNGGGLPVNLRLDSYDEAGGLAISLPHLVMLAPGATQRIQVHVEPHKRRMLGKRTWKFMVSASGGGGNEPPSTVEGLFDEEPPSWPMFAGGLFAIGAIAVAAVLAFAGGGGDSSNNLALVASPTPAPATATLAAATSSPIPPTVTPPPPATATPIPPPPPPTEVPPPPPPPEANRANCDAIRGTPYLSKTEEDWWNANCRNTNPPPAATNTPGGGNPPPPTATPRPSVPAQKTSSLVGLTITGGHGSTHRLGEQLSLCYTSRANQAIRVYDTSTPGTLMRSGVDDGTGECFGVTTDTVGVDSVRIDALNATGTAVVDYAQISIVVVQ